MNAPLRKNGGPVLDEATFQKLLAAAYVLQEHHDRTQQAQDVEAKVDNPDSDSDTSILAQIVETQHEIQSNLVVHFALLRLHPACCRALTG